MIQELNDKNFYTHTKTGLKLVEFYTDWCSFCQKQKPIIENLSQNGIWIGTINAEKHKRISKEHSITGFPTFLLFKNGEIISRLSGFHDKSSLITKLMENLK